MPYVKTKFAHLQSAINDRMEMLQVSNQQLGQALLLALRERDNALAQVAVLEKIIKERIT